MSSAKFGTWLCQYGFYKIFWKKWRKNSWGRYFAPYLCKRRQNNAGADTDRRAYRRALEVFQYSPQQAWCQQDRLAAWLTVSWAKGVGHHRGKAIGQPARGTESAQGMASFLLNFFKSLEGKGLMMNDSNLQETNIRKSAYLCRSEERSYFAASNKTNFKED